MSSETGYAMALLKASLERGAAARVADELPAVEKLLASHAGYFYDPKITAGDKADMLRELLDGKADALTVQFAVLLAGRRRLRYLPGIRRQFDKMAAAALGRVFVRLWVPYELNDELLKRLQAYLEDIGLYPSGQKSEVSFDIIVDKGLIGGFIAESGGRMLDLSLKTRLERLRRTV